MGGGGKAETPKSGVAIIHEASYIKDIERILL